MRLLTFLLLFLGSTLHAIASETQVFNMRMWQETPQTTRFVFDLSAPVIHSIFTLHTPDRLVIDFKNAVLKQPLSSPSQPHPLVKNIRSALRNEHDLRVVFDLQQPVRMKSFVLQPSGHYGHRLVLDIHPVQQVAAPNQSSLSAAAMPAPPRLVRPQITPSPTPPAPVYNTATSNRRDIIIAIDAGHGGMDPGAIGKNGTYEKTVVLAISRELAALINRERGMRAVLVRTGDYYLKLRQRIDIARQHQADLFLSIHADAYADKTARGASVYMLSRRGASSEAAKWLAEKENAADLVGGLSLNDKEDVLASVLLDLSQTGTLEASSHLGEAVLASLKKVGKPHHRKVQQAAFMVLRSPDIPSILIETAFISNPEEERKLNTVSYRRQIAQAILAGLHDYFAQHAPPGTVLARQ